ncbi:MAG: HAD-IA family hydrolase [Synergistaceae bacterium]|jgi:HAD superfamily hydrolase (TIGR01549 family)|nr:HAD-IA family hydrolase [Synergistaceae bacterium]
MSFKPPYWSPSEAEAVLFDWDGIIANTHLDFSALHKKYYGERKAMLLEDSVSLAPRKREALLREIEELEMAGAATAVLVPGAPDVIAWFEKHGVPWAVVSRNCGKSIIKAAETLSVKLPEIVRSRDDGDSVKPDPRALADTCRALGADIAQTLLIGDYIYDMMGARRAGMRGVLVRKTVEPGWDEWLELYCRSMNGLLDELESPSSVIPWEYQETAKRLGTDFHEKTAGLTVLVPDELSKGIDRWLLEAASFGIGSFAVADVIFTAGSWKGNASFEPARMGAPLIDAVRGLLRARFPLASVERAAGTKRYTKLPDDIDEIEGFLLEAALNDG